MACGGAAAGGYGMLSLLGGGGWVDWLMVSRMRLC